MRHRSFKTHLCPPPEDAFHEMQKVSNVNGRQVVTFERESVSEETKKQLDPKICNVERMLESGISLRPSDISSIISAPKPTQEALAAKFEEVTKILESNKTE